MLQQLDDGKLMGAGIRARRGQFLFRFVQPEETSSLRLGLPSVKYA